MSSSLKAVSTGVKGVNVVLPLNLYFLRKEKKIIKSIMNVDVRECYSGL